MKSIMDSNTLQAIVAVCGVLAAFAGVANNYLSLKLRQEVKAATAVSVENSAKLDAAVPTIVAVHAQVQAVAEQTNGMIGKIEAAAEERGARHALANVDQIQAQANDRRKQP